MKPIQRRIPVNSPDVGNREIEVVTEAIRSSWISSLGKYVTDFESRFSRYVDSEYGVATNSGTTALHLALVSLGIKPGDEVIMPSFTMIASINSVEYTGASTILVDSDEYDWCMDVNRIEEKITDKTKAIMPVHIYGHPTDMDPVMKLAEEYNLDVVEDAAEAHGATYKGKKTGSIGKVGCFSFYANKIVTTGEGGMCVTSDSELSERLKWLRAHAFGREGKHFWHEELGFGYRMSALQGALGIAQMERIDEFVDRRIKNAKIYNDLFSSLSKEQIILPPQSNWAKNVYWMYSIRLKRPQLRESLMSYLENNGIETRTFFFPVHRQPYYRNRYESESYPVADALSESGLNLPSGNTLSEDDIHYVVDLMKNFFKGHS